MKRIDRTLTGGTPGDHLHTRFYQARKHSGLTQKEAAEKIAITSGALGKIERGGVSMVSDPATIVRAAHAYGVSQIWLYAGSQGGARLVPEWYAPMGAGT